MPQQVPLGKRDLLNPAVQRKRPALGCQDSAVCPHVDGAADAAVTDTESEERSERFNEKSF